MTDPSIRPATTSDAESLAPLVAALGYPASGPALVERLRAIAAFGPAVVLVADAADDVDDARHLLGVITAHVLPTIHGDAPAAWITALVVSPTARRLGVGRRLVRAVEAWAASRGAVRMSVTSGLQRADAHAFYEGLGYAASGRRFTRTLGQDDAATAR